jgi:chemotaxis protein methyltransferase WspC
MHGVSAQAYYLLGLVTEASESSAECGIGSAELRTPHSALRTLGTPHSALYYYRKALYLEPNHYETLLQMATLSGKKGDTNGARLLHKRAKRVLEKT